MEVYGKILSIVTPFFLLLVLLEKGYGYWKRKDPFNTMDTLSSMSSGYTNAIKDVLGLSVSILSYQYMVEHWAVFTIPSDVGVYVVAFITLDFTGYAVHRMAHEVNFFWNKHAIHHSSEEFNLACALRQSISSFVSLFTVFLFPAAFLGVPTSVIGIVAPLHLFAQFWYHTVYIGKLGFLEHIIVTPSHHRVHHAINPEYLDKNHGQIFIFWDKIFGTFQEELPHVPPVYGITRPAATWNPIKINFQHLWLLIQDAWRTQNWGDKFRIWFMPTGWRPADVQAQYPDFKIEDPYNFQKYNPTASLNLKVWTWVQFLCTYFLLYYLFNNVAKIGMPNMFYYGAFLFLTIFAYSELMDKNPNAIYYEAAKNMIGVAIIIITGDWFGMSQTPFAWGIYVILAYFVVSTLIVAWFVRNEVNKLNLSTI